MTASTIIDGEMRTSVKSLRSGCPWVSKIYRSPSSTYYDGRAAINGLSGGLETRIDGFVERLEEGRPISFAGHHRGHTAGNDEIQVGDTKEAEERAKVWLH